MIASLTGRDTVIINGIVLNDLADGDCAVLSFPNNLVTLRTGKGGNAIYAFNYSGQQCKLVLRLIRGSTNDRYLNQQMALFKNNPSAFSLMTGSLTKNVGDGAGNVSHDTYTLSGGVFEKETEVKENAEGDIEQAVAVYSLAFSNAPRSIG
jgi:hypothetical protein